MWIIIYIYIKICNNILGVLTIAYTMIMSILWRIEWEKEGPNQVHSLSIQVWFSFCSFSENKWVKCRKNEKLMETANHKIRRQQTILKEWPIFHLRTVPKRGVDFDTYFDTVPTTSFWQSVQNNFDDVFNIFLCNSDFDTLKGIQLWIFFDIFFDITL
jgi:hypothetical protein